jgi:hypothetical protein
VHKAEPGDISKRQIMKTLRSMLGAVIMGAVAAPALAAETPTVESLLAQGYAVVGTITSQIGPGVFLQKDATLFLCFVSETPSSEAVTTRYCKPVR